MSLRPKTCVVLVLLLSTRPSFAQNSPTTRKTATKQSSATQLSAPQSIAPPRIAAQRMVVQQYPVPNFRGRNMQQVREMAVVPGTTRSLFASITATNTGTIVESQDIPASTMVVPGQASLRLTFAPSAAASQYSFVGRALNPLKTVIVPSLFGETLPDVMRTMDRLHLRLNVTGDRGGTVQRQDPAPNTSVEEGTPVTLTFVASVKVPSVKGLTVGDARQVLANASLRPGAARPFPAVDDRVTDQFPQPGASVPSGSPVNLVTVHGPSGLNVPSLIGDTQEAAVDLLTRLRLTTNVAGDRTGTVFRQAPPAGTPVAAGTTVTIYLHSLHVPNLVGLPLGQALRTLNAASLRPGSIGPSTGENDQVIRQDTPPGTDVVEGTRIGLTTQTPPPLKIAVPFVIGDTLDTAQNALQSLHLTSSYNGDAAATVVRQSPDPGAQVDLGTQVTLQMGARNVQVPLVTDLPLIQAAALLRRATLQIGSVGPAHGSNDRVLSQSLRAGAMVPPNTQINLVTAAPQAPTQQPRQDQPSSPTTGQVPPVSTPSEAGPAAPPPAQTPVGTPTGLSVPPDESTPTLVRVPDLVRFKLNDAAVMSVLASSHLLASFMGPLAGIAVWQNPPADVMVPPGTTVQVQLEVAQVVVPNLRRDDAPTALQTLSSSHLRGNIQRARWAFLGPEEVVDQEPMPGSMANEGSSVHLVMGNKPGPLAYVMLSCLAGLIGLGVRKMRLPHPPTPPPVCTLSPEKVLPDFKVRSEGPRIRYAITLRDHEVETRLSIKDPPSVTELR